MSRPWCSLAQSSFGQSLSGRGRRWASPVLSPLPPFSVRFGQEGALDRRKAGAYIPRAEAAPDTGKSRVGERRSCSNASCRHLELGGLYTVWGERLLAGAPRTAAWRPASPPGTSVGAEKLAYGGPFPRLPSQSSDGLQLATAGCLLGDSSVPAGTSAPS